MYKWDAAIKVLQNFHEREIQERGFHFQSIDFYSLLNDLRILDTNRDLWHKAAAPLDIDWNLEGQLEIAKRISGYVEELCDIPQVYAGGSVQYCWQNGFWNNSDALVQYGFGRDLQPKKYVAVGCGWSSLLLQEALQRSEQACAGSLVEP